MDEEDKENKRKSDRRTGERRAGTHDETYKRLVEKGIFSDSRKGERRKGERRTGVFKLSDEEKYAIYFVGMNRVNLDRRKLGMEPTPALTFARWKAKKE